MEEYKYSIEPDENFQVPIGTKFVFAGYLADGDVSDVEVLRIGRATGSCTVYDGESSDSLCDFYISFDDGGVVALSGSTNEIEGRLQVTGAGGAFMGADAGFCRILFDPAGNPVLYAQLTMS